MRIKSLDITSFRNLVSCHIEFSDRVNIFYGKNGAGKTNILEAIFVLLLARSPRGASDAVMLQDSFDVYRIEGEVDIDGNCHKIAVAFQTGGRKKITIDEVTALAAQLFEKCTVVSAAPEDIEILAGPPAKRREFVNIYLSQASHRYLADLSDYQRALVQKNGFLKQENNAADTPYDDLLIKYGTSIMIARAHFLDTIARSMTDSYIKISRGQAFSLNYRPSVKLNDEKLTPADIEQKFKEKLDRYRERERVLQIALVGPHRDDVEFTIGGFPARSHGSQGELRTASISLKLAVFEYLREVRKTTPILLLDEVFAELDSERKEMLIEQLNRFGQIFLTTASQVPESLAAKASKFKLENGATFPE